MKMAWFPFWLLCLKFEKTKNSFKLVIRILKIQIIRRYPYSFSNQLFGQSGYKQRKKRKKSSILPSLLELVEISWRKVKMKKLSNVSIPLGQTDDFKRLSSPWRKVSSPAAFFSSNVFFLSKDFIRKVHPALCMNVKQQCKLKYENLYAVYTRI